MKQSSTHRPWLSCALAAAVVCLLVACESDDGYLPEVSVDSGVLVDAHGAADVVADVASNPFDAPSPASDAVGMDGLSFKADADVSDSIGPLDAAGDAAPLAGACNIYDPASCPAANMKCDLARDPATDVRYTACRASGAGKAGDSCTGGSQCGRGLVCINTAAMATCRQVCNPTAGVPACMVSGQTCAGRSATYGVTFCL